MPMHLNLIRHQRTWGVVSHLKGVKDSEALRKAVDEIQPENVKIGLRLAQSKPLYQARMHYI